EKIFDLLTDPRRHRDLDGSGAVRDPVGEPDRLVLGSRFGMSMHVGLPYRMVSTVIEYEPNRRLAWQTHGPTRLGRYVAGRVWRYELEPVGDATLVRESWDISRESWLTLPLVRGQAAVTRANIAATLARIEELVAGR
ncbi:SRPBCC family protein, partial [Mycobacterium sp. NPDC003449]